tara:strand:+ start:5594 stop:5800 length:207 start_codon:yes stop_codon:yes gene_type:complete
MRKFKLNTEKKDKSPTDAQVKRQKDFSRLHHDYEKLTKKGKKPLYKDPKLFILFVLLAVILLLVFLEG